MSGEWLYMVLPLLLQRGLVPHHHACRLVAGLGGREKLWRPLRPNESLGSMSVSSAWLGSHQPRHVKLLADSISIVLEG